MNFKLSIKKLFYLIIFISVSVCISNYRNFLALYATYTNSDAQIDIRTKSGIQLLDKNNNLSSIYRTEDVEG